MIQQKSNYQTNMAELLWFLLTKKEGVEGHFRDVANKTNVPIISKKRPVHKLISDFFIYLFRQGLHFCFQ